MLTLLTESLLFKHGFSEVMSNFKDENNFWPEEDIHLSDRVLVALVEKHVLPKITQNFKYIVMDPPHHNLIRITHIEGKEVDWNADFNESH